MKRIEASQTLPAREQASGHNPHTRLLKRLRPDSEAAWQEVVELEGLTSGVLITERGLEAQEDNCDIKANTGQESTGVEIVLQISHNALTRAEEYI